MNAPVRVGFVGLGMAGRGHLQGMANCERAKVVYVADSFADSRQQAAKIVPDVEGFDDYHAMLQRDDLDLVVIATPHYLHLSTVIDSLRAGKHVLCEKPLAMTMAECDQMMAVEKETGKRLFVVQTHRLNAPFAALKKALDSQDMGHPVGGIVQFLGYEGWRMADLSSWKGTYEKAGGGVLLDGGCHVIDLANWYFGRPTAVTAFCRKPPDWPPQKAETTGQVIVQYESGALVQVLATFEARLPGSFTEPILEIKAELYYEEGSAQARYAYYGPPGAVRTAQFLCRSDEVHHIEITDADGGNFDDHTVDCLLSGAKPVVSPQEAAWAVAVAEAAYESDRTGARLSIP